MAKTANTRIFKAKTVGEAVAKAKASLGPNFSIVNRRDITESNLFSRMKLGGETLSVELEVALDHPEPAAGERKGAPAGPHPLLKSYAKAREGVERHGPAERQAMAGAAAPFASVGDAATGIAGRLDEMRRELAAGRRENAELWDKVRMIVSLQARGGVPAVAPQLLDCHRRLVDRGAGEALARDIVEELQRNGAGALEGAALEKALLGEIARRIPVAGPLLLGEEKPRVVALVGASGVGKTTSVVKLALQFAVQGGKSVGVINEDLRRPGAESQINNLGRLFGISVTTASRPDEIRDAAKSMAGRDLILVDTGGRSPRDKKGVERLAAVVRAAGAGETHLLLSAVTSGADMRGAVEAYRPTGFDRIMLTKLDECASPGGVMNVCAELSEGIGYVTAGPDYTRPIEPADAATLAELVLGLREIPVGSDGEGGGDDRDGEGDSA